MVFLLSLCSHSPYFIVEESGVIVNKQVMKTLKEYFL